MLIACLLTGSTISLSADSKKPKALRIGIVENQYDHAEAYLTKAKIDYSFIKYRDLEKESTYKSYDVIFFPCGAELPLTSSVNILSRGTHIEGVTLNDQYYKIDMKLTGKYIKKFIEEGGSAYFSDFSFRYLQDALSPFSFYKDFPYIGLPGQVKCTPSGELFSYMQGPAYLSLYHSGWIVPSEISNAETLLSGDCETPLGIKNAPLASLIRREKGNAVYTTYHDSSDPFGIMRYLIFRTIYKNNIDEAEDYISKWEQTKLSIVVDRTLSGESSRVYRMKLKKGRNYLYFRADSGVWQIDIFDAKGSFLFTKENTGTDFVYFIKSPDGTDITVKIIPLDPSKFNVYTASTAAGFRIFPYYLRIILGSIGFVLLFFYLRFLKRQRFKGRVRHYEQKDEEPMQ